MLETINRVRDAEQEADRLIEEARVWEKEEMARALRTRKDLLEEAIRAAEEELRRIREAVDGETEREKEAIDLAARQECEDLRAQSGAGAEAALLLAEKVFLSTFAGA